MKLAQSEVSPTKISGAVSAPTNFQIKAGKAAFKILSDGLYSNKIGACIRELACNAYDSHVEAGKKATPIEIHLPTAFEPWFSVKDHGVGMSNEAIEKLYSTYFSSSRNESNDFVGALGLGSKSPFCYTKGFMVTSRHDGYTRIYDAKIDDETGVPMIVLLNERKTPRAGTGLEVRFPVNVDDCWEFENNAKVMLETFDPQPKFNTKLVIPRMQYVMKTDRWGMRATEDTHQGDGIRAIQGMVQYAVGKIDVSKMGPELQRLTEMPLDLFFPIGELQVAASRESLQLDPQTVANIHKALEDVYHGLVAEVKKKIDECKQPWEARLLIFSLINAPGTGKIINEAFNKGQFFGKYANFDLQSKKPTLNELDYLHTQVHRFSKNWRSSKWGTKSAVFTRVSTEARALARQELNVGTKKRADFAQEFEVEPCVAFVVNDLKGGDKYIHYFLQEADDNPVNEDQVEKTKVYVFGRASVKNTPEQVVKEATVMLQKLGNPPSILMSELKKRYGQFCDIKTPPKPSVPKEKRDISVLDMTAQPRHRRGYYGSRFLAWSNMWKRSNEQPDGVKYYVVIENNKATKCGFNEGRDFHDFVKNVLKSGAFGLSESTPVYGLKPTSPLIANKAEWVEFTTYVMGMVPQVKTPEKEKELSLIWSSYRDYDWEEVVASVAADKSFPSTSPMKAFADALATAKKHAQSDQNQALAEIIRVYNSRNNGKVTHGISFDKLWKDTTAHYPMMQVCSLSYAGRKDVRIVKEYIKAVDQMAKEK